jgi:hypothetical protein
MTVYTEEDDEIMGRIYNAEVAKAQQTVALGITSLLELECALKLLIRHVGGSAAKRTG